MEMGSGYDDTIGCTEVVSVSTLCNRYSSLAVSLLPPHVKFTNSRLSFSLFYFSFSFHFIFLFLEQLGLGLEVIGYTVTSVQSDRVVTTLVMRLERTK